MVYKLYLDDGTVISVNDKTMLRNGWVSLVEANRRILSLEKQLKASDERVQTLEHEKEDAEAMQYAPVAKW